LHGLLADDPADLARREALAAQEFGIAPSPEAAKPFAKSVTPTPIILLGKKGLFDSSDSPSDSTGAIGTGRYIELVNSKIGIYDLSLNLLKQDTLTSLFAESGAHNFDPQIIWDPTTNRFYYGTKYRRHVPPGRRYLPLGGLSGSHTRSEISDDWAGRNHLGTSMWTVPCASGNRSWRTWNWKSQD